MPYLTWNKKGETFASQTRWDRTILLSLFTLAVGASMGQTYPKFPYNLVFDVLFLPLLLLEAIRDRHYVSVQISRKLSDAAFPPLDTTIIPDAIRKPLRDLQSLSPGMTRCLFQRLFVQVGAPDAAFGERFLLCETRQGGQCVMFEALFKPAAMDMETFARPKKRAKSLAQNQYRPSDEDLLVQLGKPFLVPPGIAFERRPPSQTAACGYFRT